MQIRPPRFDNFIRDLGQMQEQNWAMIGEMKKNDFALQSYGEFITCEEFYRKIQEWYGIMETSNRLLGEIAEEMSQIQKEFDAFNAKPG